MDCAVSKRLSKREGSVALLPQFITETMKTTRKRSNNLLLNLFTIILAFAGSVANALEMVGSNLCDTGDFGVLVQQIVKSRDATIFQGQDNIASGQDEFMVGTTKNGIRRGLLAFDFKVDDFPPDAKVECTEIRLYVSQNNVPVPEIVLHRITKQWETSGSHRLNGVNGGAASTSDVTWGYANYPKTSWNQAGGDFDNKVVASKTETGPVHSWGNTLSMARLVQEWIEVGDTAPFNAGFMLVGEEQNKNEKYVHYNGIENAPDLIPRLIVTYTSPLQGKEHREYTDYVPEDGYGPVVKERENNALGYFLLFFGGTIFGGLVVYGMKWLQNRKRNKLEPDPIEQDASDLDLTDEGDLNSPNGELA